MDISKVQDSINSMMQEDQQLVKSMSALQKQFDDMRLRRVEISGAIKTIVSLFKTELEAGEQNDTEIIFEPRPDSDERSN